MMNNLERSSLKHINKQDLDNDEFFNKLKETNKLVLNNTNILNRSNKNTNKLSIKSNNFPDFVNRLSYRNTNEEINTNLSALDAMVKQKLISDKALSELNKKRDNYINSKLSSKLTSNRENTLNIRSVNNNSSKVVSSSKFLSYNLSKISNIKKNSNVIFDSNTCKNLTNNHNIFKDKSNINKNNLYLSISNIKSQISDNKSEVDDSTYNDKSYFLNTKRFYEYKKNDDIFKKTLIDTTTNNEKLNDIEDISEKNSSSNEIDVSNVLDNSNPKIFWSIKQIKNFQNKIKLAFSKIKERQKHQFNILYENIKNKERNQILRILKDKDFRDFYKLELKKPFLLKELFINDMPDIVHELIEFDNSIYFLSNNFIFEFIEDSFRNNEYILDIDEINKCYYNFIKYEFYDKEHFWLLLWFYSKLKYYDIFYMLLEQNINEITLDNELNEIYNEYSLLYKNKHNNNNSLNEVKVNNNDNTSLKKSKKSSLKSDSYNYGFSKYNNTYISYNNKIELLINNFSNNKLNIHEAVKKCLEFNFENLATYLVINFNLIEEKSLIDFAIKHCKLRFLQIIWETVNSKTNSIEFININQQKKNSYEEFYNSIKVSNSLVKNNVNSSSINNNKNIKSKSLIKTIKNKKFSKSINTINKTIFSNIDTVKFNNKSKLPFSISELIDILIDNNNTAGINEIITTWKYIENDKDIIEKLFEKERFDEISHLIWKNKANKWEIYDNHFRVIIYKYQLELISYFLTLSQCRIILNEYSIQNYIVENYIQYGNKLYYAAIMLSCINIQSWNNNLTKECCRILFEIIKNREIMNCHSPIITCLLICEFMKKIANISVEHQSRCDSIVKSLFKFVNNIQESNPNEIYINFLMQQKDIKGRNCFEIASENNYFEVLESPELGTIVKKMWNGKLSAHHITKACSINKLINGSSYFIDNIYNPINDSTSDKYFSHNIYVWIDSCSLRYFPETIFSMLLIFLFNLYVYFLVYEDMIMEGFYYYTPNLKNLYLCILALGICLNLNNLNYIIYCKVIRRKVSINYLTLFEFLFLIALLLIIIDPKYFGYDKQNDIDNIKIDFENNNFNYVESQYITIIRISFLAFCDIVVWMKITVIMLTWNHIGPLIHITYLMMKVMLNYIFVLILYITCFSGIFTIIFYKNSSQFSTFTNTVTTLFSGFINNFDCFNFSERYQLYGGLAVMFYVTLSGMLIINLLIAFLSNFYRMVSKVVNSTHRTVLISYYRKYKWNSQYGWMLYTVWPFNIINYIILLVSFFIDKKKKSSFNLNVTKILHSFYILPILLTYFFVYSLVISIIAYFKGFFMIFIVPNDKNYSLVKVIYLLLKWFLFGYPNLLLIIAKDIIFIIKTYYKENPSKISEIGRIKKFISDDNVLVFLKFIHSRNKGEPRDLHNIFVDYLKYEEFILSEKDLKLKEKMAYLSKVQGNNIIKNNNIVPNYNVNNKLNLNNTDNLILKSNNLNNSTYKNSPNGINSFTKKNLIIIEILENFVIDDNSDNLVVDVDKLKMLIPKTTKIDNDYLKRLVFTNINSVNKAIDKLKSKKNSFLQNNLLRKLVASAIRVDAEMDEKEYVDSDKLTNFLNKKSNNNMSYNSSTYIQLNNTSQPIDYIKMKKKESLDNYLKGKKIDNVSEYEFYTEMNNVIKKMRKEVSDIIKIKEKLNTDN